MQKHVNLVDLVKSFPTNIYLQNLASIQKRTSPVKFAHLAEKSGKGSISNLSTEVLAAAGAVLAAAAGWSAGRRAVRCDLQLKIERLVGVSIENEWKKTGTWAKIEKIFDQMKTCSE